MSKSLLWRLGLVVALAALAAWRLWPPGETINLGHSEPIAMRDLIGLIDQGAGDVIHKVFHAEKSFKLKRNA